MPHGTPDWGLVGPKNITYGLDDLGEHAVRLGSPHLWDRRGDTLYLTDFRDGLGMCQVWGAGTGHQEALMTGAARQGAYNVRLRAGSDGAQNAYLQLSLPFQDPSCASLEFSFSVDPWTATVRDEIGWYTGSYLYTAWTRYNHVTKAVEYWIVPGVWQVIDAAVPRHECIRAEHTMKLVVDMTNNQYVRYLLDERMYDLRGTAIPAAANVFPPYWYFYVLHYGVAGHTPDSYIDNVIVTQNEPR